ncbi:MAG: hypothetical protein RLZZ161_1876 [Bacteroidota bacterium]
MKNIFVLFSLLYLSPLCGKQHLLLRLNASYSWGDGNADYVKIKLIFYQAGKADAHDSFFLRGPLEMQWRRSFDQMPDSIMLRIVDHTNRIPQQNTFVRAFQLKHCQSQRFENLLKKGKCESFPLNELGTLCAALDVAVFDDLASRLPVKSGSQQSEFYCEKEATRFRLNAPCFMNYRPAGSLLQWYESSVNTGPWSKTDTGLVFSPVAWMKRNNSPLFNQKRYYKLVLDSFTISGEKQMATEVLGPVYFYVNAAVDSISVYGRNCRENEKRIDLYLNPHSSYQHASGVNVWLKNISDSSSDGIWFLGNEKNVSKVSIGNTIGQFHTLAAQNAGKPFHLVNGKYAVGLDFTPWNDFDCGFRWDSVQVSGPYGLDINHRIICGEKCPGNSDGKFTVTGKSALWNDTILINLGGPENYKIGDTMAGLARGIYSYSVAGNGGCLEKREITIGGSPFFGKKLAIDTVLCIGQQLNVYVKDSNAALFEAVKPDGVKLFSDTLNVNETGDWFLKWTNDSGCVARDTMHVVIRNLSVTHDFLMPTQIKLPDTAWAIDHSRPKPASNQWVQEQSDWKSVRNENISFLIKDTGFYPLTLISRFDSGCSFRRTKMLKIVRANDTAGFIPQLGYQGPLIKSYILKPNPSNGMQYQVEVVLREPADLAFSLLDPISGRVLRTKEFKQVKTLAIRPFDMDAEGVYFIRVQAVNEMQTRKVLFVK